MVKNIFTSSTIHSHMNNPGSLALLANRYRRHIMTPLEALPTVPTRQRIAGRPSLATAGPALRIFFTGNTAIFPARQQASFHGDNSAFFHNFAVVLVIEPKIYTSILLYAILIIVDRSYHISCCSFSSLLFE